MKILFISHTDPSDKMAGSGMTHSMFEALKKKHEVEWIGPFKLKWQQWLTFIILKGFSKIFKYTYPYFNSTLLSRTYARQMQHRVDTSEYDIVFAPMASSLIADVRFSKKIIYQSDATFAPMLNYYLFKVPKYYQKQGNYTESQALQKSAKVILCSPWAKNTTLNNYSIKDDKISIIGWGPNLDRIPQLQELNFNVCQNDQLQLTFVGVDWKRKGGDIVYRSFKQLKEWGINCRLTIVGCVPPFKAEKDIIIYPKLNKNKKNEFEKLYEIYKYSHFLIVPSRAECYGLVFCEASAFGVPSIATDTGGISAIISNDINGYLFSLNDDFTKYAEQIKNTWIDKEHYNRLRKSTRLEYEKRLNWGNWIDKVNEVIKEINC